MDSPQNPPYQFTFLFLIQSIVSQLPMSADAAGDGDDAVAAPKKKQRVGSGCSFPSSPAVINFSPAGSTGVAAVLRRTSSRSSFPISSASGGLVFNDASTADVIINLRPDHQPLSSNCLEESSDSNSISAVNELETQIYSHAVVLRHSKYFAALLSDRWRQQTDAPSSDCGENSYTNKRLNIVVRCASGSINHYVTILRLLYSDDLLASLDSASTALSLLPIALDLLFEECIEACVKFLEAVPWSEDEEMKILNLIPLLSEEESKDLLARVSPLRSDSSDEMLHGLIFSAIHNHPNMAFAKAFVAKLLREFSSRESARRVLDTAFQKILRVVKQSLEGYLSPVFRGDHNETEAIQRLSLHNAMTNAKHLLWLVERMIELRVADTAVKAWSEQATFAGDLRRAFHDGAWKNIVPSLPSVVLRCTCRLASAVVTGNTLAARQVRMKLVRDWLPVLIICKDSVSLMGPNHKSSLHVELEEAFLNIISTLPMSDSQELLQQCLSLTTRNVDGCTHLVAAFTTWFRRANRPPQLDIYEQ